MLIHPLRKSASSAGHQKIEKSTDEIPNKLIATTKRWHYLFGRIVTKFPPHEIFIPNHTDSRINAPHPYVSFLREQ